MLAINVMQELMLKMLAIAVLLVMVEIGRLLEPLAVPVNNFSLKTINQF